MVIAVIIIAYALGFLVSYRTIRNIVRVKMEGDWILLEKIVVIILCLWSWLILLGFLLLKSPLLRKIDIDKPCKW